jgi:hypothetical protein
MVHLILTSLDIAMSLFASISYFVPMDILAWLGLEPERCARGDIARQHHNAVDGVIRRGDEGRAAICKYSCIGFGVILSEEFLPNTCRKMPLGIEISGTF